MYHYVIVYFLVMNDWIFITNLVFFILSGVWETWYHCRNTIRWCNLTSINHDQAFHKIVIHLSTARLDNINVFSSDTFSNFDTIICLFKCGLNFHGTLLLLSIPDPKMVFTNTYHVSILLNFLVTTFPMLIPRRSHNFAVRSGWEVPKCNNIFI